MLDICDSFLVNVCISEEENKVEVVMYHGYMREVINLFEGNRAKDIAAMLLNRSTHIPEAVRYEDDVPVLLGKEFTIPEEKEILDG